MKDLKHLIYFENLLQEANNDLVKQAKAEGKRAIGYTCYFMPEVLLDLPGCFSVRLRAPRCTSPDIATYYMSARVCHYARSLLERALEGGFNFLDAQMATETCTVTCRFQEHIKPKHLDSVKDMNVIQNDKFFCEFTDVPFKNTENDYEYFRDQLRAHVLTTLHDNLGIDVSDKALKEAIKQHNEVCKLINEIGDYRKLDNPTITGYEFHVIQLVSLVCPKYLILPYLRETAKEMKTRKPDAKWPFRCKVVLAGSENDDPDFTKLVESCGAEVVCDRYCYGAVESRQPIVVEKGEDPLYAIAKHYLKTSNCPRFMPQDIMRERKQRMQEESDACIVLPGGIGTLEEFFEILTLKQLGRHGKAIVIFNQNGFYDHLLSMLKETSDKGFMTPATNEIYTVMDNSEEILDYLESYKTDIGRVFKF